MLSGNILARGLKKRKGPVDLTTLEEFRETTDGKHFLPPKKVSIKGLRVSGKVIGVKDVFRDGQARPFATTFKIVVTGKFSPEDVGDPQVCTVIDQKTAWIHPMWSEYFAHDTVEKEKFFKEHPDASREKRTYKDPVPIGKLILKPMSIIDVQVTLKEPAPGIPAPRFATSAGEVELGNWITFTNLHFAIKRQSGQAKYEAGEAVPYPCSEFEDFTRLSEFSLAFIPFPNLPESLEPTTEKQAAVLAEMRRQMQITDKKAVNEYFISAINSVEAEQVIPDEELEKMKSMLIFRNPDAHDQEFLHSLGIDVMPLKLYVDIGSSTKNGAWNTITTTVNACLFDEDGQKSSTISYLLKFYGAGSMIMKKMHISSWPGTAVVSRLIEQAIDSLVVYGSVDIGATMSAEQMVDAEGNRITDTTVVVKVEDMELDMVSAIQSAGLPLTFDTVSLLLKNNELGTVDCRKGDWKYTPEDNAPIINLTETSFPASPDYDYYMVACGLPQINIERFKDKCQDHFKGDVEAASDSVMKYLLGLKGADTTLWAKEVAKITFTQKMYEAPMIFGINKVYLQTYRPRVPTTADEKFKLLGEWQKKAVQFYSIDVADEGQRRGDLDSSESGADQQQSKRTKLQHGDATTVENPL